MTADGCRLKGRGALVNQGKVFRGFGGNGGTADGDDCGFVSHAGDR